MRARIIAAALAATCFASPVSAQSVEEFYKGKSIRFLVGYGPGTGYDVYMRVLQRHIGKHIPGRPTVVPENMPGAGGLVMANYLYNVAPRDGTAIGLPSRNLLTDPLHGNEAAKFDALKFNWLGSISSDVSTCFTWRATGKTTLKDAMTQEIKIGGHGPQADSAVMPRVLNALIGTKFKTFNGYTDSGAVGVAMEQGELDGYCSFTLGSIRSSRPVWLERNQIAIIAQLGPENHPDLKDVPNPLDMLKDDAARQAYLLVFGAGKMGRPVAAPPGVPADRVAALRRAFDATLKDPEFLDDIKRSRIDMDGPSDGATVESILRGLYATPKAVVDRVTELRNRID